MGRLAEYTTEQILEVGNSLEAAGERVSPFAIREKLGGGDARRIKEIWTNRKKSQKKDKESLQQDGIELPIEIQEALEKNLKVAHKQLKEITEDSFKVATFVAEKRVTSTIKEYQSKISEYEASEKDAFQALENSDRYRADLEHQIESLSSKNETLVAENSKLIGMMESLQGRVTQLEKRENELANMQIEFGKLQGKIETMESNTSSK